MAYINKEKALDILRARQILHEEEGDSGCADSLWDMCLAVEDLPEADVVEVKHGYWKKRTEYPMGYNCSECNNSEIYKSPFCRLCGTKMDGTPKERGGEK